MTRFAGILIGVAAAILPGAAIAQAAPNAACVFGNCSARLSAQVLSVSCDGKQIYQGAFTLSTDFQTTRIAADPAGDPSIVAQGVPGAGVSVPAQLTAAGNTISGTCGYTGTGEAR